MTGSQDASSEDLEYALSSWYGEVYLSLEDPCLGKEEGP